MKVRNVNRVVGADGVERLYLRKRGFQAAPLRSPWGTQALADEVARLIEEQREDQPQRGTLAEALAYYETQDARFLGKAESTKELYRVYLKDLHETLGHLQQSDFQPAYVDQLKDAWAQRGHRAANMLLLMLKHALRPAMLAGTVPANTFELVGHVSRPADLGEPNIVWPMYVFSLVIERALNQRKYGLARAVAIARYVGARRGDLIKLTRAARKDGRFRFLSGKRRVPVDQEEDGDLTRLLATIPDQQPPDARAGRKVAAGSGPTETLHLVFNLAGQPYTKDGLADELSKIVADLHKEGQIETDEYGLHGLRHTRGVELALAGCTDAMGAAMMGHSSPASFAQYRRQADRIRLADDAAEKIRELRDRERGAAENDERTDVAKPGAKELQNSR